ncbi:SOS response-associated peptidase [Noviherbaspirillum denitrificans]|uniref:Abasic site processing protein n=1 Tax=Noviherbaspirillum denitrificans TaxID=1968433 RepID=A0A254TLC3_9BURK|nr:SOS response-associated peptidase [Noviherbaspirillum denitrificans]OWW22122.1 hypothetical protein AYR66_24125 [Noviherbaspirillum denitrificans]
MCANYRPSTRDELQQRFGVAAPDSAYAAEAFPGSMAPLIRLPRADAVHGDRAAALGMFGLVPHWADTKLARQTYNARTETVATKPSFRNAWKRRQFCVIPASTFYEPSYETGKAERWEIVDADGTPLAIAGLWDVKQDGPNGLPLLSFTMLTINADGHPLMQRFHKPDDEKRMLVLLDEGQVDDWLHCPLEEAGHFFARYPAERLAAHAAPMIARKRAQDSLPGF